MSERETFNGKPQTGNPHARFDGAGSRIMHRRSFAAVGVCLVFALLQSADGVDGRETSRTVEGSLKVATGLVTRTLSVRNGHVTGESYKLADGTEFMCRNSPEFAFRVNGGMYDGFSAWKDIRSEIFEENDGSRTVTVSGVSSNGSVEFTLAYTTYPDIALVRKTLSVRNCGNAAVLLENVDVETFRSVFSPTKSYTMRNYGRYRAESTYIGDWNDPLVVIHDFRGHGLAIGNEGVATMKRTTTFQEGNFVVSGTPHRGDRYPFRVSLKPGEKWTSRPVFTAPYSKCSEPGRVVEGAVSDYVRRHMGVRVEQIRKKPMFVYNTWAPFRTRIDEKLVRELVDAASECGVEEFVIDDGWQVNVSNGKFGRGDWAVDSVKFPNGLKPVFDHIRSRGMRPGLWISLAIAGDTSKPLRKHPEWFTRDEKGALANLHENSRSERTACMATPWHEYIRDRILELVRDYGLAYVKLDLAVATSAYVFSDSQTGCYAKDHPGHNGWEESFNAIYESTMRLFDELHAAAPDLFIDCTFETAGKLYLMDYGIAKHAEGNWLANLPTGRMGQYQMRHLAWGRTPALPASSLVIGNLHIDGEDHILSLKSLAGTLPIMLGDPRRLTKAERMEYKAWTSWLKTLETRHSYMSFRQDLPGFGEPHEGAWDGFARINTETKSGGLVGVFRHNAAERSRRVTVRGLAPAVTYAVRKGVTDECVAKMTGAELESDGFEVLLPKNCDGELFEVVRMK